MKLIPFALLAITALPAGAAEALWLRDVQISPDGSEIAFCYKGDIYTVPSAGGTARRLTTLSSYEEMPFWSPDGKKIAFASDRNGNADIFIMDAKGGPATRLTFNSASEFPEGFTPDGKEVLYSAAIQNPTASAMYPSARMTELYAVSTDGANVRQVLGTPAQLTAFTPDGKMLYQDVKGFEDQWRKHHTSSVTRDIWMYDPASGKHTNITNRPGEDRNPVISPDGNTVYILSERDGGTFNVWAFPANNPAQAKAVTDFKTHPVRFLSGAGNGTLAFTYDGAIYTLPKGASKPVRLTVDVVEDDLNNISEINVRGSQQVPSPDGKSVAFVNRGDIFVTSVEYPTTVQVTHTPAAEEHISWGDDNRTLYYTSERSGRKNIYRATMERDDDRNFPNAMQIKEEPLFDSIDSGSIPGSVSNSVSSHGSSSKSGSVSGSSSGSSSVSSPVSSPVSSSSPSSVSSSGSSPSSKSGSVSRSCDGSPTRQFAEYSHPLVSPDGKQMAFIKDRNQIWVMDLASRKTRQLTDGSNYPGQDDGVVMTWSPDSRWLAIELMPEMRDPYSDIALLNVETGELTNITNSGYFCSNPRFVLDGNALLFFTDRYGLRAQASWGSQEDIMIAFLNRDARDRFMLSEEDYALLKEAEKDAKKAEDSKKDDKAKKGKKGKKNKADEEPKSDDKAIVVELDDIESRMMRLTPYSSSLSDAIVTADGETLYYMSAFEDGYDLWKLPLRKGDPSLVSKVNSQSGVGIESDKDGSTLFLTGAKLQKLDPTSGKLTPISISATQKIDGAAEREAMFNNMAVEEAARFYNKNMHGINWQEMTEDYRKFLPHINNNEDFAELLSEILGELNVSHTGGRYYGNMALSNDRTANLGLFFDTNYSGDGLKVDEVIVNGPFDKASSKMKPGSVITAINGSEIKTSQDADRALNSLVGKKTLVSFTTPSGEKVEEVTLPVSSAKVNRLLYDRWIRQREEDVKRWSNGRLGYVHIPSMNDASFRPMYDALMGKYNNCEGVVIDIRWNGGGRMHEDIEQLFTGEKYLTQEIRGKDVCDMPSRRWNKPSIMLVAEPCYSNAHGTPWVYQHQGIGKVVGMPVPGTMTSVNWVTMQDPSLVFGIPVIGYRTAEGNYLENTQLEPDVKVANDPAVIVTGEDTQLRTAVETLLRDLDSKK